MKNTFHATKTVSSGRAVRTSRSPAIRSRMCPSLTAFAACNSRAGMRAISAAESANEAAFRRYSGSGPHRATRMPGERRREQPREVLGGLQQRVRLRQVVVVDEVRHARVDRRPEEAGGEAGDGGKRDDQARAAGERQHEEHARSARGRRRRARAAARAGRRAARAAARPRPSAGSRRRAAPRPRRSSASCPRRRPSARRTRASVPTPDATAATSRSRNAGARPSSSILAPSPSSTRATLTRRIRPVLLDS